MNAFPTDTFSLVTKRIVVNEYWESNLGADLYPIERFQTPPQSHAILVIVPNQKVGDYCSIGLTKDWISRVNSDYTQCQFDSRDCCFEDDVLEYEVCSVGCSRIPH